MAQGDTPSNPLPADTSKIAPKVTMATAGAYLAGVVGLSLVNAFTDDDNQLLLAALPDAVEPFVLPLVPAVVALVAGYLAKHQWRRPEASGLR